MWLYNKSRQWNSYRPFRLLIKITDHKAEIFFFLLLSGRSDVCQTSKGRDFPLGLYLFLFFLLSYKLSHVTFRNLPLLFYFLCVFSHQCWLMVFHYNLSDSKSLQVFRTLFSILSDLSNTVLWIVVRFPTFTVTYLSIWGSFQVHQSQLVSPSPSCSPTFLVLWRGPSTCFSFCFLTITIIFYSLRVFHIRFSGLSFIGVWVTTSLLKTPGLFSAFWPFSIML